MVKTAQPRALLTLIAASLFFGGDRGGLFNLLNGVDAACVEGEYWDSAQSSCEKCAPGKFVNATAEDYSNWPTECDLCPGGKYVVDSGSSECIDCLNGEYSVDDRTQCASCEAGEYVLDGVGCQACEIGKYAPQALSNNCLDCEAGSYTFKKTGATTCTPCDAGTYSAALSRNCSSCGVGTYSGFRATSCTKCEAGYASDVVGSSSCSSCPAGKNSRAGASTCKVCPAGFASSEGDANCTACNVGNYAATNESSSCTACAAGSYAALPEMSACTPCEPGSAQGATGQANCVACVAGKSASEYGTTSCTDCQGALYSFEGASTCTRCIKDYYYAVAGEGTDRCLECPRGSSCDTDGESTQNDLLILAGYWRIAAVNADNNSSVVVHECPFGKNACAGGTKIGRGIINNSYCEPGHEGPLCAVCSLDHYMNPDQLQCMPCIDVKSLEILLLDSPSLIIFMLFALGLIVFAYRVNKLAVEKEKLEAKMELNNGVLREEDHAPSTCNFQKFTVVRWFMEGFMFVRSHFKTGKVKVKVLIAYFQIASNVAYTCRIRFPLSFTSLMSFLGVFNLNVIPSLGLACRLGSYDYVDATVFSTLTPIIISGVILVVFIYQKVTTKPPRPTFIHRRTYKIPDTLTCEYTKEEFDSIILTFAYIDTDLSGSASRVEVEHALKALGLIETDDHINAIFSAIVPTNSLSFNATDSFTFGEYVIAIDTARREGLESEFTDMVDEANARVSQGRTASMVYVFLVFSFCVLVGRSSDVFSYFQCQTFTEVEPNQSFLELDYGVDCNGKRYQEYRPYVILMLFIYPIGIPLLYLILLEQSKSIISNPQTMKFENMRGNPSTGHLTFLIESYKPELWYFEVIECGRRLLLASFIGILSGDSATAPALGVVLSLLFINVFEAKPYRNDDDSFVGTACAYSLTLIFLSALTIKVDIAQDDANEQETFGILLILVFFAGPLLIIAQVIKSVVLDPKLEAMALKKEAKLSGGDSETKSGDDTFSSATPKSKSSDILRNQKLAHVPTKETDVFVQENKLASRLSDISRASTTKVEQQKLFDQTTRQSGKKADMISKLPFGAAQAFGRASRSSMRQSRSGTIIASSHDIVDLDFAGEKPIDGIRKPSVASENDTFAGTTL